jgi:hypothetical protein
MNAYRVTITVRWSDGTLERFSGIGVQKYIAHYLAIIAAERASLERGTPYDFEVITPYEE